MSELPGRQKYIRLSKGPILVTPKHKRLADREVAERVISLNQLVRELIEFGDRYHFFTSGTLNGDNLSEGK